jgi:radical SAM superfamily enzyme YgiQ (UPF0313 family)
MSSLGYLSIYSLIARRQAFSVERFFWREEGAPLSHETGRPLEDFPVICASLSFECDYWLFWESLRRIGITEPGSPRRDSYLIAVGGIGPWSNPYPVMPIADVILTGEGELGFNDFLDMLSQRWFLENPKREVLSQIAENVRGALVPSALPVELRNGRGREFADALAKATPVVPPRLPYPFPEDYSPPSSPIYAPGAEFSGTKLVEISRGCPYGCRFCLAGSVYRPHRPWEARKVLEAIGSPNPWDGRPVFPKGSPVGLVSPAVADHPHFSYILDSLVGEGRKVSFSSLRLSALTEEICSLFAKGKVKGIALAPETGSECLREAINKNVSDALVMEKLRMLADAGLSRLKLYFMIGLPGEKDSDLLAIRELTKRMLAALRGRKRSPQLTLSVANFAPKPHTAFEDAPFPEEVELLRKGEYLKKLIGPLGGVDLKLEQPAATIVQALLSRGGPESFILVDSMRAVRGKPKALLRFVGYRDAAKERFDQLHLRPWRIIAPTTGIGYLEREKGLAEEGLPSAPCPVGLSCGNCGACDSLIGRDIP